MSHVYVISDYGKLSKQGDALCLTSPGSKRTIFPHKTDKLIIMGKVDLTNSALQLLMREQIHTIFLNKNGRFNGQLEFQDGKNVFLRRKQYQQLESAWSVEFVRSIVTGKLQNQLSFMQRTVRRKADTPETRKQIERMHNLLRKTADAESIDSLRGYEGAGAAAYFSIFQHAVTPDWAVFNGRSRFPPRDNVNAVLSFLYTMVLYQVESAIEMAGMDPYVGYLHTLEYGKKSLVFDLMEEYRTPIADMLTVSLFNTGVLNEDDFEESDYDPRHEKQQPLEEEEKPSDNPVAPVGKPAVLLTKPGLAKVIARLEKRYETSLYYEPVGDSINYKRIIRNQVKHYKRVLNGEEAVYKPLQIR